MPPAKTAVKSNSKGKQRATDQDGDADDNLDPLAFVQQQVEALSKPLKLLDRAQYFFEDQDGKEIEPPQQKALDKAVKALSLQLAESRKRKYTDASVHGIVEQIEYLKEQQASEKDGLEVDEDGKIRVAAEDWLEELPEDWPVAHENSGELDEEASREYRRLLSSIRALQGQQLALKQKEEHYALLSKMLNEDIDVEKLQLLLQGGEPKQKKTKKGKL